ncbi:MAG TPA: hypothetical protein ENN09_05825 [Planctomycetes bacterium]|nr:hypothetical protein [Planctomycetota bacterium]
MSGHQDAGAGGKIIRATAAVMTAHGLLKVLGLVLTSTLGGVYGVKSAEMDVYATTFTGIMLAVYFIFEKTLSPAFLPLFMERKDQGDEAGAWRFASTVINVQGLLLLVAVGVIMLFPERFIMLVTQWRVEGDAEGAKRLTLASGMLRLMAPGLVGLSVAAMTYMLLNGYKRFFVAAFGEGTLKIIVLLSICVPLAARKLDIGGASLMYVGAGVLVGSWGKLATHIFGLGRKAGYYRPVIDYKDPMFRRLLILAAPLLIGIVLASVRDLFNNIWVLSGLESGIIACNDFGKKIYSTIGFLAPTAVSIAMFPFFCEMVDRDDMETLGRTITQSLRIILFLFVPMSAGVMVVSVPIARVIYQHGNAAYMETMMAGTANAAYMAGLAFWAAEMILMQAFFSNRRTITPVVVGLVWSTVSMLISYIGIVVLKVEGIGALVVVAGGVAFARAAKTVTLALILRLRVPIFRGGGSLLYFLKLALLTAGTAAAVYGTKLGYERISGVSADTAAGFRLKIMLLGEVAVAGLAGFCALVGLGLLLRMEEIPAVYRWAMEKLKRRQR